MKEIISAALEESVATTERFIRSNLDRIVAGGDRIAACFASGHKLLVFGNGGSAADAQHIAAEFVNRFQFDRLPLAALALTTDTSVITSIGNDASFEEIFTRQIRAFGSRGDIAWGISTSGNSENVLRAVRAAGEIGLYTIGLTGRGGALASLADLAFSVDAGKTARIQEAHITLSHILVDLVERILFPQQFQIR
jgi:D-sedoheptulose 7-phosphate isomerase